MMKIDKILNNNVVITNRSGEEVVVMGRGLAFGKKIGDGILEQHIEKIYELAGSEQNRVIDLLSGIPDKVLEISDQIVTLAKSEINGRINDVLFLTLADHINGLITRSEESIAIKNFLLWDIKRFFPEEFKLGKKAVINISTQYDVPVSEDEAGFIAMHIVNSELDNKNASAAGELAKLIEEIMTIVKYSLRISLNEDDIYYQRFMTHLRFFAERVLANTTSSSKQVEDALFEMIVSKYPQAYRTTQKIAEFLLKAIDYQVSTDEKMYLTIHLARIIEQFY